MVGVERREKFLRAGIEIYLLKPNLESAQEIKFSNPLLLYFTKFKWDSVFIKDRLCILKAWREVQSFNSKREVKHARHLSHNQICKTGVCDLREQREEARRNELLFGLDKKTINTDE